MTDRVAFRHTLIIISINSIIIIVIIIIIIIVIVFCLLFPLFSIGVLECNQYPLILYAEVGLTRPNTCQLVLLKS